MDTLPIFSQPAARVSAELPPDVRSLAAFRRFLSTPGATVEPIRNDFARDWDDLKRARAFALRTVVKVQSNAVAFRVAWTSESIWLDLVRASAFRFEGDTVTFCMSEDPRVIVYRLGFNRQAVAA